MKCEVCLELLEEYLDGELASEAHEQLDAHLITCTECSASLATLTAEQEVFALDDKCPHKSGPLSQGIVHGHSVTCPLHNWLISLETGKALGVDQGQVRTIPLKVESGTISVSSEAVQSANIGRIGMTDIE